MAGRIMILFCCLVFGFRVAEGVRSNLELDLDTEMGEVDENFQGRKADVCTNGETPPNHVNNLVGTMTGDPQFLYTVLTQAILGYTEMMNELKKDPPQVEAGYTALSAKLWGVVVAFIDKEDQTSKWMTNARIQWDDGWSNAPAIDAQIRDFQKTGDMTTLALAVAEIASTALSVASSSICIENMTRVFSGTGLLIDGVANASVAYSKGQTLDAMEIFWDGVNGSVYAMTTAADRSTASWAGFYQNLEKRASEFFEFVILWEEAVLTSDLCHRESKLRPLKPASHCPSGYTWDQISLCKPDKNHGINCSNACPKEVAAGGGACGSFCGGQGQHTRYCCKRGFGSNEVCNAAQYTSLDGGEFTDASNYFQCVDAVIFGLMQTGSKTIEGSMLERASALGERSSVDRSTARKCFFGFCWGEETAAPVSEDRYGARQAECDRLSLYPDLTADGKCSQQCAEGWSVNPADTADCLSDCTGSKAHSGKLGFTMGTVGLDWPVCALSETHLTVRNADLAMLAINTVGAVQSALTDFLATKTVTNTSVNGLIDVMKDVALSFAIPQCLE